MPISDHVRQAELFSGLTDEAVAKLAAVSTVRCYAAGRRLFNMGDTAEHLSIIGAGQIELRLPVVICGTAKEIVVETLTAGQTVGWSSLLTPRTLTMSAITAVDSELTLFSRSDAIRVFEGNPEIAWRVMTNLASIVNRRLVVTRVMLCRQLQSSLDRGQFAPPDHRQ